MDVRILGALEIWVDGRPCGTAGAAERELLARLAVSVGTVVPADALVDALWGDRLPVDAANALQTRVSKLRRALGRCGGDPAVVETARPGYALRLPRTAVDAERFAELVANARRLRQREALGPAAAAFAQALDLWRGPALADFTTTWATREAARLDELRLVATEERNDVALAMGAHADLVAELDALVAANPLRERLRAQHVLALYRSGRQADALAAVSAARRTLADELGIDPGEELQELERAMLRQDPSLAAPAQQAPTHRITLPRRRTSVLGRENEVAAAVRLLDVAPLLTLTGPGGAGKTTLAIESARRLQDRFADGGAFVALAGVTDPALVAQTVAEALELTAESGMSAERLVAALRDRSALVVLDNCEHLADGAAALAERLLAGCPDLRILATSREPLGVEGEAQLAVPPLTLPTDDDDPAAARETPAVGLFVERAQAVDATFTLSDDDVGAVTRICTSLDGMPLAIELAAARVKILRPADIADRLDDRFSLLAHGRRTAEARQQTLRGTVDWSHDLLSAGERRLFRRVAVFRDGWTLDAAEEVCSSDDLDPRDVVDLLSRLVDRSMVVAEPAGGRFRMLETLRHYGEERLVEAGEELEFRARHVRAFLDLAERAEVQLRGPQQLEWLRRLRAERDNLHQALSWCAAHPDDLAEEGLRLVGSLAWWWYLGRHDEGRAWVDRMLARAAGPASARARAAAHRGASLVWRPGACVVHPSARCADAARAALSAAEQAGDDALAASARTLLAVEAVGGAAPDAAGELLDAAAGVFEQVDDAWGAALVVFVRSEIAFRRGSVPWDEAVALADRAAAAFSALGDEWGRSAVLAHTAHALERRGELAEALRLCDEVVVVSRRLGLVTTLQWMLAQAAFCRLALGDVDAAAAQLGEAIEIARASGGGPGEPFGDLGLATMSRLGGDVAGARIGFAAAERGFREHQIPAYLARALVGAGHVELMAGDHRAALERHRAALGVARGSGDRGAVAVALEGLAAATAAAGNGERAAELLGAARDARERSGWLATPLEQRDLDRAAEVARALLTPAEYESAFSRGRAAGADLSLGEPAAV